ncbi:MAG: acyl-CoA/acyl-ACP dehydrogenase, partial [Chloroflexi bacterium]|nr:acyl-CoA/acyl-ACP dehydrogenase [Chloroflexota bacterium]
EQEMLKKSAREFLSKECPKKLVREMDESDTGLSKELWKKMAELGWMALPFPEKYGGNGGSLLDLTVLLDEMGYNIVPGPFFSTVVLAGFTLLVAGSEKQKEYYLGKICSGDMIMTLALTGIEGTYSPAALDMEAKASGGYYILNGAKMFVPDANVADFILVVARTEKSSKPEDGVSIFIVDAKSAGLKVTQLITLGRDKLCEVAFKDVKVPADNLVGKLNGAWPVVQSILRKATVSKCAEMVGGAQASLDMAVSYAKERVQFNRPIGAFQAIQHYCANMVTDVDGSRFITYKAAWTESEGLPAEMEVSMAKAWTSEAFKRVAVLAHQIFGAIGFTMDHDMHLYFRRAKAAEIAYGDADLHRENVAVQMGL